MQELEQGPKFIGMGRSQALDPYVAVNEACAEIDCALSCFVLAFIPNELDPAEVTRALNYKLAGVPVFGCTTAGQITVKGYESDALLLLAFPKANFRCSSILFENIRPLNSTEVAAKAQRQAEKFRHTAGWNRLALMFSDGLSKQEDLLVSTLETVLDGMPIFGGSAGDGLQYEETFVLHNGEIHCNASVLLQIETNLQFQGIGFDHFLPIGSEIIITDADPEERMVYEINGAPAALEYARLVGCAAEDLSPQVFAENPMLLRQNLNYYVRAIREVTDGQALSFLAAIDDGLIMTLGRGKEIIETLEAGLDIHDSAGKSPDFILGFDCVLRKLEIEQKQLSRQVSNVLQTRRVIGFNTYGEQQSGVHMNQTFVGVAFFEPVVRDLS